MLKLVTGVHPNCTSLHVYQRYFVWVDFILDLLENLGQFSVTATNRNKHNFSISLQLLPAGVHPNHTSLHGCE